MFELKHKHHFQVVPQCVRTSLKERQNPDKLKIIRFPKFPCTLSLLKFNVKFKLVF